MKSSKLIVLLFVMAALLLSACVGHGELPAQTETAQTSEPEVTQEPVETESTPTAEPEPTPEVSEAAPEELTLSYDAREQTFRVKGEGDYQSLNFPDEIRTARVLKVDGDGFDMNVYLQVLRDDGMDLKTELPGLIFRTEKSLSFVRDYLRENAGSAYPSSLAELPVFVKLDRQYGHQEDEEQITIKYNERGTHREFVYLLALMNGNAIGWEHLGYAWYVGTCFDPYTEVNDMWPIVPELPYYSQCIAAGVDPDHISPSDYRTIYDACARVCFERGLTHWGSYCESLPVTK